MISHSLLLVHEALAHLIAIWGGGFRDAIQDPPPSAMAQLKKQWCKDHGIPSNEQVATLGLHGDGVSLQKRYSMYVIAWNIWPVRGSGRYLFAAIEKTGCVCDCGCGGWCALGARMNVFHWSMMALFIASTLFIGMTKLRCKNLTKHVHPSQAHYISGPNCGNAGEIVHG